jgi:hypothetical protein
MERVFRRCASSLNDVGRLVIVFANKQPDAWETLVSAIILTCSPKSDPGVMRVPQARGPGMETLEYVANQAFGRTVHHQVA